MSQIESLSFAAQKVSHQQKKTIKKAKNIGKLKTNSQNTQNSNSKIKSEVSNTQSNTSANSMNSQLPTNQSKVTVTSLKAEEQKKWNIDLSMNATTNLYKVDPASNYQQIGYSIGYNHQLDFANLSVMTEYNQDLKYAEGSDISDLITSLSKRFKLTESQQLGLSGNLILPVSKASRIMNQMNFAAGTGVSWIHQSGVRASISLTRFIHQFETNINGRVLSKLSSKQSISYGTEFGNFRLSLFFAHINGLTYFDQLKESWEHGQEVSYSLNDHTSFSMGHYNTGSPYKPNGYDSNYSLFNEQTSSVYIGLATGI